MLQEIDVLETRRIAELAAEARKVRDRLFEKIPSTALGEPSPARGPHDPVHDVALYDVLAGKPAIVALREAVAALPLEIRQAVWGVMEIGRGRFAAGEWEQAAAEAGLLRDADLVTSLLDEPDLDICLARGLYLLGLSSSDLTP